MHEGEVITLFTGCTIGCHTPAGTLMLMHGDLKYARNYDRGTLFLFLDGIAREKNGQICFNLLDPKPIGDKFPHCDIQVMGPVVKMEISPTGYGRVQFRPHTVFFSQQIIDMGEKYQREDWEGLNRLYSPAMEAAAVN